MVRRPLKSAPLICAAAIAGLYLCVWPAGSLARAGGVSEFEQTIAFAPIAGGDPIGSSHPSSSNVGVASSDRALTLHARRAFDLVGFRWHGGGVARIEVQSYGVRGWSRWASVDTATDDRPDDFGLIHEGGARDVSGPVWTGRSTELRVRVRGVAGGKLIAHFVKVTAGAARPVANESRAAAAGNGGVAPAGPAGTGSSGSADGGTAVGDTAFGGTAAGNAPGDTAGDTSTNTAGNLGRGADVPPAPPMVTRTQWGADRYCKPRARPAYGEVQAVVVHHTVSTNSYTQAEAPSVVLGICRYHRNSNGWNDIGYNLLVDRFGTVYEGRGGGVDRAVIGAHAQGYNGQTAGIALVGTFMSVAPPAAMLASLQTAIKWKLALAGITRNERVPLISTGGPLNRFKNGRTIFSRVISGHRDLGSTDCPGNALFKLLPAMAGYLDQSQRQATRMTLHLQRVQAPDGGQSVLVSGRLRAGGAALAGELVEIQAFDDTVGWVKIGEARSDATGFWQGTVRPAHRMFVRGSYAGDATRREGRSLWLLTPKLRAAPVTGTRR